MPTYTELIADITQELGGELPDNIAQIIQEVEDELWQELYFCSEEHLYTVSITSGSDTASLPPEATLWLQVRSVISPYGLALKRVSLSQFQRLLLSKSVPELYVFYWDIKSKELKVCGPPSYNTSLQIIVFQREDPISPDDPPRSKFFLSDAYSLLKYAVLYKRLFNPDKYEFWKSRYNECLRNLLISRSALKVTLGGGSPIAPRPADY